MPLQAAFLRFSKPRARRLPQWYHRIICRILGIRLEITGCIVSDRPVLVIANHASWLDIVVISAVAPVSFVAKKEISGWPFVATLARLQRTVFVDRERRSKIGDTAAEIMGRLEDGDAIVLFAEGTSSDGNRVLGFKTSLFAAVKPTVQPNEQAEHRAVVQTLTSLSEKTTPSGKASRRSVCMSTCPLG